MAEFITFVYENCKSERCSFFLIPFVFNFFYACCEECREERDSNDVLLQRIFRTLTPLDVVGTVSSKYLCVSCGCV